MGEVQHYVPRLLLKGFSPDKGLRSINLHLIDENKTRERVSLYNQASDSYLYGTDNVLEDLFATIEGKVGGSIRRLRDENVKLTSQEIVDLKVFTVFQQERTPQSAAEMENQFEKQAKFIARAQIPDRKKLDSLKLKLNQPYHTLYNMSAEIAPIVDDLRVGILVNPTSEPFVIGQNPVVVLNPFLFQKKWDGPIDGLAAKGAMVVLPIGRRVALVLYDRLRYGFSSMSNKVEVSAADVRRLNLSQFATTKNCIYFGDDTASVPFAEYAAETAAYRSGTKSVLRVFSTKDKGQPKQQLIQSFNKSLPIDQTFGFVGLKPNAFSEKIEQRTDIVRDTVKPFLAYLERDRDERVLPLRNQQLIAGKMFDFEEQL